MHRCRLLVALLQAYQQHWPEGDAPVMAEIPFGPSKEAVKKMSKNGVAALWNAPNVLALVRKGVFPLSKRTNGERTACRLPPAACRLPPAACRLPPAACRLPSAACRLHGI